MARTLKSDKMLFWAALLLVCASVVMVYSASAVQADTTDRASYHLLIRQLVWAATRAGSDARRDAGGLPPAPAAGGHLDAARRHGRRRCSRCFCSPPRKGTMRWITIGGLSWQPSELAKLVAVIFTAALLERRMHRVNDVGLRARADRRRHACSLAGLIVVPARLRHGHRADARRHDDGVRGGLSYRYLVRRRRCCSCRPRCCSILGSAYRRRRLDAFLDPWAQQLGAGSRSCSR